MGTSVEVLDIGVHVRDLLIPRKDIADYLRGIPNAEQELAFIQALEIGIFCLERARQSQDTEFVKRQIESLLSQTEKAVQSIPDSVEKELLSKIGTGEGQVLAPMQALVSEVSRASNERLREVRELLSENIDPAKDTSILGKALRTIRDLLDPIRSDSVQGKFTEALKTITAHDGLLATTVKTVVTEAVKPLADEVDRLTKEVRGQEAASEAIEQTTAKGAPYEEEVVEILQSWASLVGAEITHIGADNRPGDILIKMPSTSIAGTEVLVVVEVRDRQSALGRKAISETLATAMAERLANAAIYLSKTREGLAKEIGDWAEGESERGPFVATAHEHLITAVRFLIAERRILTLRSARPEIDSAAVQGQIERIRTALARVSTINRKVTDVRGVADTIQTEAEGLRDDIRSALSEIESAIHKASETIPANNTT